MAVFDDIMSSLNELIDDAQGKKTKIIKHMVSKKDDPVFSMEEMRSNEESQQPSQVKGRGC